MKEENKESAKPDKDAHNMPGPRGEGGRPDLAAAGRAGRAASPRSAGLERLKEGLSAEKGRSPWGAPGR